MPQKQIPITNAQQSSLDELAGGSVVSMNVITDKLGAVRRRPGIQYSSELVNTVVNAVSIDGIHVTYSGEVYAVGASLTGTRAIYKIVPSAVTDISTTLAEKLLGTSTPRFAETEALLVLTAGNEPQKIVLSTHASSRLGGTPPLATHVVANRLRLVMNDPTVDKSKLRYSDIATGSVYTGHEVWSFAGVGTSGYTSAEARPDPIVAIGETADLVFAFGSTNLQVFSPDPNLVYAPANTLEIGCVAPYSVVRLDNAFAWLDHHRRFVISSGTDFQVISDDIAKDLHSLATVSDCYGYYVNLNQYKLLVWSFPTEKRTFVYQVDLGWGQWSGWDDTVANWKMFPVVCSAHNTITNTTYVGTSSGYVAEFSLDAFTDLDDPIRAYVETGYINHGTDNKKHCKAVHLRLRKNSSAGTAICSLSYSDSPGLWSSPIFIDIGYNSGTETVVSLRSMGVYRNRKWRVTFEADSNIVLSGITEDFDTLGV